MLEKLENWYISDFFSLAAIAISVIAGISIPIYQKR